MYYYSVHRLGSEGKLGKEILVGSLKAGSFALANEAVRERLREQGQDPEEKVRLVYWKTKKMEDIKDAWTISCGGKKKAKKKAKKVTRKKKAKKAKAKRVPSKAVAKPQAEEPAATA